MPNFNNSNIYVIYDPAGKRLLNGLDFGKYEWTTRPEVAWSFTDRQAAIDRAAYVAYEGHNVQVITRKEAIQLLPYGSPQKIR